MHLNSYQHVSLSTPENFPVQRTEFSRNPYEEMEYQKWTIASMNTNQEPRLSLDPCRNCGTKPAHPISQGFLTPSTITNASKSSNSSAASKNLSEHPRHDAGCQYCWWKSTLLRENSRNHAPPLHRLQSPSTPQRMLSSYKLAVDYPGKVPASCRALCGEKAVINLEDKTDRAARNSLRPLKRCRGYSPETQTKMSLEEDMEMNRSAGLRKLTTRGSGVTRECKNGVQNVCIFYFLFSIFRERKRWQSITDINSIAR